MIDSGITILTTLITAHLLGDFVFQTDKDVSGKEKPSIYLKHLFIVTALSYALCGLWNEWRIPLVILVTHGIFDWLKTILSRKNGSNTKQLIYFISDQLLHLFVIIFLAAYLQNQYSEKEFYLVQLFPDVYLKILVFISTTILLTKTGGIIIGFLVSPFLEQIKISFEEKKDFEKLRGFVNGGLIIGYLERVLIFIFIYTGSMAAVGFLIAAKSIFRFGEISNPNNRMEVEYIIIGTLYSFTYALILSIALVYFLKLL
jgi:hypothetical protein